MKEGCKGAGCAWTSPSDAGPASAPPPPPPATCCRLLTKAAAWRLSIPMLRGISSALDMICEAHGARVWDWRAVQACT